MAPSLTRSAAAARRYFAALLLFVAGFLAQGLHSGLESHEVCEHGELVHVENGSVPREHHEPEHDDGPSAAGLGEHESSHHHCGIAVAAPLVEQQFAAPLGVDLQLAPEAAPDLWGAPRVERIARLRLAPHHSPPEILGA